MKLLRHIALFAALAASLSAGCNRRQADDGAGEDPVPAALVPVRVAPVRRGDLRVTVSATGRTDVLRKEKVLAPAAGRLVRLSVVEFQEVRKGDTLAVIRSRESQAAIDGAQELLRTARTPRQEEDARRALELASDLQSKSVARAGVDGIVFSRAVTEGELVSADAELLTIIDPSTLRFIAEVPLQEIGAVRTGQSCLVRFPGLAAEALDGVVEAISPGSNLESVTTPVRIRFRDIPADARPQVRPGMAGMAEIVTGVRRNVLLVPASALRRDDETDTWSVVTLTPDSLTKVLAVRVGERSDSTAEVAAPGLREGLGVVTEGHYALADSVRVTLSRNGE